MGHIRKPVRVIICGAWLALHWNHAWAVAPSEYEIKAAFIHNIARFVAWPAAPADGRMRLCTLGSSALTEAVAALAGEQIDGLRWDVRQVGAHADLLECRVLLIASSETGNLDRILESISGSAIMTVGNDDGYAERGVMFGFYLENKKVRIKINVDAAKRAGLKVSSQLLKLARIVPNAGRE